MKKLINKLFPVVTKKVYHQFIATGEVSDSVLEYIAGKVMKQEQLTPNEQAIFIWRTDKINEIIVKKAKL